MRIRCPVFEKDTIITSLINLGGNITIRNSKPKKESLADWFQIRNPRGNNLLTIPPNKSWYLQDTDRWKRLSPYLWWWTGFLSKPISSSWLSDKSVDGEIWTTPLENKRYLWQTESMNGIEAILIDKKDIACQAFKCIVLKEKEIMLKLVPLLEPSKRSTNHNCLIHAKAARW